MSTTIRISLAETLRNNIPPISFEVFKVPTTPFGPESIPPEGPRYTLTIFEYSLKESGRITYNTLWL